ncbi:MAG: site-specific integrase [Lachnospiraceae bacterium]|nr:site-specific integrase [Lachnospiraceae bacterium]
MSKQNDIDLLLEAYENGMIDMDVIQQQLLVKSRKKYLEKHSFNIWQGKNGSYYTYLPDEHKPRGKRLVRKKDRRTLNNAIVEFYRANEEDPYFEQVFQTWVDERLSYNEIERNTYDRYCNDFKRFIKNSPLNRRRFSNITEEMLETFIKTTIRDYKMTAKVWGNLRILIRGTFKYAKKKGYTDISITNFMGDLDLSKNMFRRRYFTAEESVFTRSEERKIIDYIDSHKESLINLGIKLDFETGLRAGELSALKREDVNGNLLTISRTEIMYKDENGRCVYPVREHTKGRDGMRKIILTKNAVAILNRIMELNPDGEYLFMYNGKRTRGNYFTVHLEKICKKVGILPRSLHKVRKTYATKLLNGGVDETLVIRQMGHTDISTTRGFYYFDNRENSEAVEMIQKAIGGA